MNPERLNEVVKILSRYSDSKELVDYYQLLELDQNMTLEELQNQIKKRKIQVLFHPDQISFIPLEYQSKYLKMIEIIKDVINTFDSPKNKVAYDRKLQEQSRYDNNQNFTSYSNRDSSYQSYEDMNNKTQDLEALKFREAIVANAMKYGFEFTRTALRNLMIDNSVKGFTRDHNVRNIISSISKEKIISILSDASVEDVMQGKKMSTEELIMNYLTDLIFGYQQFRNQVLCLEQACLNTIYRYDLQGYKGQTYRALERFSSMGDVSAFTNTNNARNNLITSGIETRNIKFLMQCSLNSKRHENPNFAYQNLIDSGLTLELYYDMVYQEAKSNTNSDEYSGYGQK